MHPITQHYLAYGSNLHPLRLAERVPSSRLLAITRLARHTVSFVKRSRDRSAKCSLVFTDDPDDAALCAVYELDEAERYLLDRAEGFGTGYEEAGFEVRVNGWAVVAFTYVVAASHFVTGLAPYDWYKALVLEGARFHGFPDNYIARLDDIQCMPDPDPARNRRHAELLDRIRMLHSGPSKRLDNNTKRTKNR